MFLRGCIALLCILLLYPFAAQAKGKKKNHEPLFGPTLASYTVTSHALDGAIFYLVSGHGGPDPGAIGQYQGKELHEDEYAYDITLRLARELLTRGAKVHIIIQDAKDGIRETYTLSNSKRETCMGAAIPLNQTERLHQRCAKINSLSAGEKSAYKRAVFIHVDSRSKGQQTDVFFYHAPGSKLGKRLAGHLQKTFRAKYNTYQPGRGFNGSVSERNLYVLRNSTPVGVFLELGNIQNKRDQQRLVIPNNRQALAKWIAEAIVADHKN
jgi:N-acetylmuramoyl-L-alanine amidase